VEVYLKYSWLSELAHNSFSLLGERFPKIELALVGEDCQRFLRQVNDGKTFQFFMLSVFTRRVEKNAKVFY